MVVAGGKTVTFLSGSCCFVIFHQSECCVRGRKKGWKETSLQAHIISARPIGWSLPDSSQIFAWAEKHLPWSSRGIKLKLATHNAVEPIYEFVPNLYNKISPPPSDSHKIKKKHLKDNEQERSRDFINERGGRKGRGREGEGSRLEFRRSFCKLAYTAALPCVPAGSYSCSDMASELHSSLRVSLNSNFRNSFGYAFHIFVCIFSVEPHLHTHLYG